MLPVVAGEILLRGFALPALSAWKGLVPAALIVSVLFGGLTSLAGQPGVARALDAARRWRSASLYVATGSLLPGIALASAASAVALGAACALPAAGIAALWPPAARSRRPRSAPIPALQGLGAARRPLLRGSAA